MSIGAMAAAEAQRRRQEEEEEMTPYGSDDLSRDWEFKIVRSNMADFRKPEHFNRLLKEEARAGWSLVEKFDNSRVRFKRPREARLNDATLPQGVDPYRVQYGISLGAFIPLLIVSILALVGGVMALIVFLVKTFGGH